MKSRTLAGAVLAAVTAVTAAACSGSPSPHGPAVTSAPPPPSAQTPPPPAAASVIGFTGAGLPQSWAPAAAFSTAIGRPVDLAMYYSGWGEKFQAQFAETTQSHGAEVMVNLAPPGSLATITTGSGDGYLRRLAGQIKAFGHPVVLAFGHEANGDWYSYGYRHQPASEFIAAYRHVHDVITAAGAVNVTWLWTVNIPAGGGTLPPSADWPGAADVSMIGIDGYDWTGTKTFAEEFGPTIAAVRKLSSAPVIVAETSVIHGSNAASQVTGLLNGIREDGLVGLVWFDTDKAGFKNTSDTHDWRLQDDPAALAAFRAGIRRFG
jgi:mannan endo-1,4-beta-mannosidase